VWKLWGKFAYLCFLIDIPFKGSQSLSNMRSKVTAVSYLHSGVIDTAVPWTAKSDFLIKKISVSNYSRKYSKKVGCTAVDSAVHVTAVSMTLLCNNLCRLSSRIRSHIRKGFNLCIRDPGEVVWWKKQRSKISCQCSFKAHVNMC
jgi:hypothetical protein